MAKYVNILTSELYRLLKEFSEQLGLEVIETDDALRVIIDDEIDLIIYAEPMEVFTSDGRSPRIYGEIYYSSRPVAYLNETAAKYLLEKLKGTLKNNKE